MVARCRSRRVQSPASSVRRVLVPVNQDIEHQPLPQAILTAFPVGEYLSAVDRDAGPRRSGDSDAVVIIAATVRRKSIHHGDAAPDQNRRGA